MDGTKILHRRCSELPVFMVCASSALPAKKPIRSYFEAGDLGKAVHEALGFMVQGDDADTAAIAAKHGCHVDDVDQLFSYGVNAWGHVHHHFDGPEVEGEHQTQIGCVLLTGHQDVAKGEGVLDWKSGRVRCNVRWQLCGYGRLLGAKTGVAVWLRDRDYEVIPLMEPDDFDNALLDQVDKIGKEYVPGDHCGLCPRRLECKARNASLVKAAKLVRANVDNPISRDNLAELWPMLGQMEAAIKYAKDCVRDEVSLNGAIQLDDTMELALCDESTRVIDLEKSWPILTDQFEPEQIASFTKIGVTKLEKAVKAAVPAGAPRGSKGRAVADLMADLKAVDAISYKEGQKLRRRKIEDGE
jgi:hypothetical protein